MFNRRIAFECECCGGAIYEGERYWDFGYDVGRFCQTCVDTAEMRNAKA